MFYSLQGEEHDKYKRDELGNIEYYTDADGNKFPLYEDGTEIDYSQPKEMNANISFGSNEVDATEYGLSVSDYDATIITSKGAYPDIQETSIIWYETEPQFIDANKTSVDPKSADFRIVAIKPSLRFVKYVIKRNTKWFRYGKKDI